MLNNFLKQLQQDPESIEFTMTMDVIEAGYSFTETAFDNGELHNEAGQNSGSCKLFAFAQLNDLSEEATLACFGTYYRDDVLANPDADNHQNIRNFMKTGWSGIKFEKPALLAK